MFMPSASWVARWNNLEGKKPGVYAVSVSEYMDDGGYADIGASKKNAKKRKRNTSRMRNFCTENTLEKLLIQRNNPPSSYLILKRISCRK